MDEVSRVRRHSRPGRTDFIFIMINNIIQSWTLNYFTKQSNGNFLSATICTYTPYILHWPELLARQSQHTRWRTAGLTHISLQLFSQQLRKNPSSHRCGKPAFKYPQIHEAWSAIRGATRRAVGHLKIPSIQIFGRSHWWSHAAHTQWALVRVLVCYYKHKRAPQILLCCKFMAAQEHRGQR